MADELVSTKRTLINKANSTILAVVGVTCFVIVFCLVAGHVLFSQLLYQNRIISAKKTALAQLKTDARATSSLVSSYQTFIGNGTNVLGGSLTGTGSQDGDNGKIVLDALPSKYDFPALTSSLEKLLSGQKVTIQSISGTDEELSQPASGSTSPTPVAMPFQITVSGSYANIQNVVKTLEKSIRPIQVQTLTFSGSDQSLTMTLSAQTYYQPEKTFSIGQEVIK